MRTFVVLCLLAVASAQYDYQQGGGSSNLGGSIGGGGGGIGSGGGGIGSGGHGTSGGGGGGGGGGGDGGVDKEYYTFTANEEDFDEPLSDDQNSNAFKKSVRVIFIKGPENNGFEKAALALAKQAADQKTAIYVLNRQPDLSALQNQLQASSNNQNNKPDVHFVKYRTPEDAATAQQSIQQQYDQLGGRSQSFNGGVAPALNYATRGVSQGSNNGGFGGGHTGSTGGFGGNIGGFGGGSNLNQNYLPPSLRFRRFRRY